MKRFFFLKLNYIGIILILTSIFIITPNVFATQSLTITPTSGQVGTTITAKGNHFYSTNGTVQGSPASTDLNFPSGSVYVTGATLATGTNKIIQFVTLNTTNTGIGEFHAEDGSVPGSADVAMTLGTLSTTGQVINVPVGMYIEKIQLNVTSVGAGCDVRTKLYDNAGVGSAPKVLEAQSNSISVASTGLKNFTISHLNATQSNFWVGAETDCTTLHLHQYNGGGGYTVAHTYGTGPNPFGSTATNVSTFWARIFYKADSTLYRVKIYANDGGAGAAGTLLGETAAIQVTHTGLKNFTLNTNTTSFTNVYTAFESNNTEIKLRQYNGGGGNFQVTHTFGSGPNPFGAGGFFAGTFWSKVYYYTPGASTIIFKFDNSILSTTPTPVTANSSGGFSGVTFTVPFTSPGSHVVNASDITGSFASQSFSLGTPQISVSPNSGTFGSLITLSGTGFGVSSPMTFTFNGVSLSTFPSVTTNSTGGFSGAIAIVPSIASGTYLIQGTDGFGVTASTPFVVGSTTPSLYVTDLHYTSLTDTTVNLAWSFPSMGGLTFSGFQINYTTPFGTPQTIIINNSHSSVTSFILSGLTGSTDYSFRVGTVISNGTVYAKYSNILSLITLTTPSVTPPSTTIGNVTLNYGTNPLKQPFNFYRQNINTTALDLFVSYPNTYNTTCNFNYEFANQNKSYYNLATTANGTGRVKATFQFLNLGNEIVNTVCRDVITNDTGRYTITNSIDSIPMVQQIHNFENGVYGTQGQFGAFDLVELGVIIISMIALNRISEPVGAIIMIIIIGALAYFHIGSFYVTIFSAIAMVILLVVSTSKKLAYTP